MKFLQARESPAPDALMHGRAVLLIIGILALAAVLRFPGLGRDGLWSDEAQTYWFARLPLCELVASASEDNHAPAYYVLIRLVLAATGPSEWALRFPSAVLGVLAVWLTYRTGQAVMTRRAAVLAAFLLAVSPMAIHYSREARTYALMMVLVLAAFRVASRISDERPGWALILAQSGIFLAMMVTHNIGPFLVAGLTLSFLVSSELTRPRAMAWLAVAGLTTAGYLPWMVQVISQLRRIDVSYAWALSNWQAEYPWQVLRSLAAMTHGSLAPIRNHVTALVPSAWVALLVTAALAAGGVAARRAFASPRAPLRLILAVVLPMLGLWCYCLVTGNPVYVVGRTGSSLLPLFLLAAAAGVEALRPRLGPLVALAFLGLAVLPLEVLLRFDFKSQERSLAHEIRAGREPGEPLIGTYYHYSLYYYLDLYDDPSYFAFPSSSGRHPGWDDREALGPQVLELDAQAVALLAIQKCRDNRAGRLWLVVLRDPLFQPIEEVLDSRLQRLASMEFDQLRCVVHCYAVPQ